MENPRLPATGRSPRARERAKGARPTPGSYNTLCKTRMRFATETFLGQNKTLQNHRFLDQSRW